jgi:predicted SprT family Zn-dependent metalloprotease
MRAQQPTIEAYGELVQAFDFFNAELFDKRLSQCLLTFQREKHSCGYFSENRFANLDGTKVHEIAMNPSYFAIVPISQVMQTLVHEMTHLWQKQYGTPSRGRYHNTEWGNKMESIGLMPSATGMPGGARTGDNMADYIIDGGRFFKACEQLLSQDYRLSWYDRFPPEQAKAVAAQLNDHHHHAQITMNGIVCTPPDLPSADRALLQALPLRDDAGLPMQNKNNKKATRVKYTCTCNNAVWGKPNLRIRCCECNDNFEARP